MAQVRTENTSPAKSFGAALRAIRRRNGETQETAAAAIGIAKSSFAKYERGEHEPSFYVLQRIVEHYKVPIEYFLPFNTSAESNLTLLLDIRQQCVELEQLLTRAAELEQLLSRAAALTHALRVLAGRGGGDA